VGVGNNAGNTGQGVNAVAIGKNAGQNGQGAYAVAIGNSAGNSNQSPNSIAINANSNALAAAAAGFYVNPIRSTSDNITTYLAYDTVLNEIQYKTLNAAAVGFSIDGGKLEVSIGGATYRFAPTHINGVAQ
jgi:hypothetical protein